MRAPRHAESGPVRPGNSRSTLPVAPQVGGLPESSAAGGAHRRRQHYTPAVRTVFAFPAGSREETIALLTISLPQQSNPWVMSGALYIDVEDEGNGTLYVDWEADELAVLDAAVGHRPSWAVQIDISGRVDGTTEVHQLLT
jgi:hypothetical protein